MITSETPYKLAEIIRDTWPGLYRLPKSEYNTQNKKRMYTPEGYINDPPDAKCPYCGQKQKSCSYVNSLYRYWYRQECKKKNDTSN